mgnify:CR=1 FL=1
MRLRIRSCANTCRILPTSFALSEEAVGRLRASGAQVLRDSPAFRALVERLAQPR